MLFGESKLSMGTERKAQVRQIVFNIGATEAIDRTSAQPQVNRCNSFASSTLSQLGLIHIYSSG
jgi:hypothetical protein